MRKSIIVERRIQTSYFAVLLVTETDPNFFLDEIYFQTFHLLQSTVSCDLKIATMYHFEKKIKAKPKKKKSEQTDIFWRATKKAIEDVADGDTTTAPRYQDQVILEKFRSLAFEDRDIVLFEHKKKLLEFFPQTKIFQCLKLCGNPHPAIIHICEGGHAKEEPCPECEEYVTMGLECGHLNIVTCKESKTWACAANCENILLCGHQCQLACSEKCGPCPLRKSIIYASCGHERDIPCIELDTIEDYCHVLVDSADPSPCGHSVQVPCGLNGAQSMGELARHCQTTCRQELRVEFGGNGIGCGHICQANCADCTTNRFHGRCKEPCGRTLICGHTCIEPCSKGCSSCRLRCEYKCPHGPCKRLCGVPCTPCRELCPWKCIHKACTKLCSEICDRKPCCYACSKTLLCGHPCVGVCGEICPPQCRICTPGQLIQGLSMMSEDLEPNHKFIYLQECGHSIEVGFMDKWMVTKVGEEIQMKRCPLCNTVVYTNRRYNSIIVKNHSDIERVKRKTYGYIGQIVKIRKQTIEMLGWETTFALKKSPFEWFRGHMKNFIFRNGRLQSSPPPRNFKFVSLAEIQTLNTMARLWKEAEIQLIKWTNELAVCDLMTVATDVNNLLKEFANRSIPFPALDLWALRSQWSRCYDLGQLFARRGLQMSAGAMILLRNPKGRQAYDLAYSSITTFGPYTAPMKKEFRQRLKTLDKIIECNLGITDNERMSILSAIGLSSGRWFKCSNGHVYLITECGGPSEIGVCPECGNSIGGTSHELVEGNALASEMDGAIQPLYPGTVIID